MDDLMATEDQEIDDIEEVEPIFRDSGQACYVAYLFCSMPASPKSPMFTAREMVEDGDLDASRISGIRFGEHISPLEIRGECARVIAHVEETLHGVELDAIRAKYDHGEERVLAMARVRDMLCDAINTPKKAMTRIVARQYGSQETKAMLSDYAIAGSVGGISHDSVRRARQKAKKIIFGLESEALSKLSPVFVAAGISKV